MKKKIKGFFRRLAKRIRRSFIGKAMYHLYSGFTMAEYHVFCFFWSFGGKKPSKEDAALIAQNVTFIYKSFERQKMAKRLFRCIQKYYPGARVIVADDSKIPLQIDSPCAEVLNLPYNSGLGYGLNRALEKVETPFTVRMDDDELLTPRTRLERQLRLLFEHPEIDLAAVQASTAPFPERAKKAAARYDRFSMSKAPLKLKIPHMTRIDETHVVKGKTANIFIVRTDKFKEIGYDDNIRVIDHHEFFYRAAGRLVSCMDETALVFHYHNPFDDHYLQHRGEYKSDEKYIIAKHNLTAAERK